MDEVATRLSAWVVRWAWPVMIMSLLFGLAFAIPLKDIEIDPEIKNQLPEHMPSRMDVKRIEGMFGGSELVMLVLTTDDVLAPETLTRVKALGDALAQIPTIEIVVSPFNLTDIRGDASGMLVAEPAIVEIPTDAAGREALRTRLKGNELAYGNVVAKDFKAISIIGMLSTQAKDSETTAAINALVAAHPGPETLSIGGMPSIRQSVSDDIRSDIRRFAPFGVGIIIVFLLVTLRQARGVYIPFSTQILALLVSVGLIPLLGWKVQMVTVTLPVILLAVGNDHTVHLIARFQEENLPGNKRSAKELTISVLKQLGMPVIAAGTTTVAGFLCLQTHIVIPAKQLGILAAVGVTFAMVASLTYAPAMLSLLPVPKPLPGLGQQQGGQFLDRLLHKTAELVIGWPKTVIAVGLLAAALATAGMPWLKVDTNPINYYPSSAPVAVTAGLINEHLGGSTEISVMIEGDVYDPALLAKIDTMERELGAMGQVGYTMSIARVVKIMNRAVSGDPNAGLPTSREAIAQLFLLYSMSGDNEAFNRMVDPEFHHALVTARVNSFSTGDIAAVVEKARHVGETQLAGVPVTVGGFGAVFAELVDAIVRGQVSSLLMSFFVVGLLDALCFWSIEAGLWSLIPLVVSVPSLFGLMGWSGIELNVVTAMLSSIMIGVGVDYTIHFLWRYREERRDGLAPDAAAVRVLITAGRGIVFNALSVIVGFSILFLSNFLPIRFFGFLVVVSIATCLLAALVLMPPLVVLLRPRFAEFAARAPSADPAPASH